MVPCVKTCQNSWGGGNHKSKKGNVCEVALKQLCNGKCMCGVLLYRFARTRGYPLAWVGVFIRTAGTTQQHRKHTSLYKCVTFVLINSNNIDVNLYQPQGETSLNQGKGAKE